MLQGTYDLKKKDDVAAVIKEATAVSDSNNCVQDGPFFMHRRDLNYLITKTRGKR